MRNWFKQQAHEPLMGVGGEREEPAHKICNYNNLQCSEIYASERQLLTE